MTVWGIVSLPARRALAEAFRAANLDTPELDARVLIGHALGLDHAALTAAGDRMLRAAETTSIAALATRRLAREPVARIIGVKEFWSLPLRVNAATLGAAPGNRNCGGGSACGDRCERIAHTRAANRRPRHRIGRAAARFAVGTAERSRYRHRYECRRSCRRTRKCRTPRMCTRRIRRVRSGGGVARPVRSRSSPIRPTSPRTRSPHWRRRCVTMTRASRSTAVRMASTFTAPSQRQRARCSRPAAILSSNSAPARRQRSLRYLPRQALR